MGVALTLAGLLLTAGGRAAPGAGVREALARPSTDRQAPARTPDIYFVPTSHAVADAMLRLADVTPEDIVYDLGSGDGRLVILAAQKYGARGVGVELDPRLVLLSRTIALEGGVDQRVRFIEADLFTADISDATVVTLYLSPNMNRRIGPRLRSELRPGARVVSHQFPIPGWTPDRVVKADDGTELFRWTVSQP
jgi:SAM-dependent methyltransferase